MLDRRRLLQSMAAGICAASLPGLAFASSASANKLVLVVLRGAVDGLALAAPYGDRNYRAVRGELALDPPGSPEGLLKLDGMFGLHPSLAEVHECFSRSEASIIHAVASPYRERSHFDGQDLLESGADRVGAARDGWLNRALQDPGGLADEQTAIALALNPPLVLRGNKPVASWAPSKLPDADEATLRRLENLYADDEFFSSRLEQALRAREIAGDEASMNGGRGSEARQFVELMAAAARFLSQEDGPTIAVTELGGWDTHANQGSYRGALANQFAALDKGLGNLKAGLGKSWQKTVVLVVTEFGRTVRVNGTRGTDHGTGAAAILVGGAVNGGKLLVDWPGLAARDLYEGRDLMPTTDLRSLFKTVLTEHLQVAPDTVEQRVFPQSAAARPLENLLRT